MNRLTNIIFAILLSAITGCTTEFVPDSEAAGETLVVEGMITDPVYEGKSMAGLIGMIESGEIPAGSRVLYAHLGGQPCLSAYDGVI